MICGLNFPFLHLLALKAIKTYCSFDLFPVWFSCFLQRHFYSVQVPFILEQSEVLSVVIVIVLNYEYFNLHLFDIHISLQLAGKPHQLSFSFSFCLLGRFLYSVYEYSDNIYSFMEMKQLHRNVDVE